MKKMMALFMAAVLVLGMAAVASADQLSDIQAKGVLELGANIEFPPYEFYWTCILLWPYNINCFDRRYTVFYSADRKGNN